jgi:hypothetical protein
LAGLALASGFFAAPATSAVQVPDAPEPMGQSPATAPAPSPPSAPSAPTASSTNPLDEPLRLLARAQQVFRGVRDYTCTLIKQERMNGQLQPVMVMSMMVRNEPFSIYLKWHQPRANVGQEACYVAGRNGGKMRAKATGVLGVAGFVSIDPDDPRARKNSNHSITEAGLANLLGRFDRGWRAEYPLNRLQVRVGEYEYNKRRCMRVETTHTTRVQTPVYRSVVYFDKEVQLPIRVEAYDWPRQGGNPGGELIEVYNYVNLRLNVNLPDEVFNK